MILDYYLKKKHLFKGRSLENIDKRFKFFIGSYGFISTKKQRFDIVFIRFFKKLFRRRFKKIKVRFFRPKYYLRLRLNYICSMKSKNARMGSGVGKLVRVVAQLACNTLFLEFKRYPRGFIQKTKKYLSFKCNLSLSIVSKTSLW